MAETDEVDTEAAAELLGELGQEESEPKFDDEERDEAESAERQARLLRLKQDEVLYQRLADTGFAGTEYGIFRGELTAYALPVIRSWLRRGLIFAYARRQGRPLHVTDYDRECMQDVGERVGLTHETVATALIRFHKGCLAGTGWNPAGGAALTTYFVGSCVSVFPNIFRAWQRDRANWNRGINVTTKMVDPVGRHPLDLAHEVVSRQNVADIIGRMPEKVREVAELAVWKGLSQAEIASNLGTTERAVEGLLYRFRKEYRRRYGEGR